MSEPRREQIGPPPGISINFDASKNSPILVKKIVEAQEVSSLDELLREGPKYALEGALSSTRMDGKVLLYEHTSLFTNDFHHPAYSWQGLTVRPESEITHNVPDGGSSPYDKERAEKIREILFNNSYRSSIREVAMSAHAATRLRKIRQKTFDLLLESHASNNILRLVHQMGKML